MPPDFFREVHYEIEFWTVAKIDGTGTGGKKGFDHKRDFPCCLYYFERIYA